MPNEAAMCLAL
ncbi:hypothetical protein LT015_17935 [Vibrio cholerae]|nr:hypothetical protein [Vibrio cholerae]MCO7014093.1 hypothetical protein [Vibrio paracholerae]MCD6658351.1 hypothetical protein [Vibrio cholerae]MCO7017665.1 hypothetical protein [Vibrio paracholerae]MCO7017784.1 hypothetical protein [Vibrio paracholerae]MCO7031039.1 hypothetical protein [Vibrio paracholerae]